MQLDTMSVKDLRQLRDDIDAAIRSKIAQDRMARTTKTPVPTKIDLESERDAWQARRVRA